ncbi:MAG: hypothetical protein AAGK04_11395 [Planctomycetota bacterium]
MASFPTLIWLLLGVIGAASVLAYLHMVAALLRNELGLHDLQVDVATLQIDYHNRLQGIDTTPDPIENGPAAAAKTPVASDATDTNAQAPTQPRMAA